MTWIKAKMKKKIYIMKHLYLDIKIGRCGIIDNDTSLHQRLSDIQVRQSKESYTKVLPGFGELS